MEITADKTLALIEKSICEDNGKRFKELEQQILPTMHDAYKADPVQKLRDHLGASILGEPCKRKVWFNFRGFNQSNIDARMIRLFNRGHLEEARFHAVLQASGIRTFWEHNGRQYGYRQGMFAGSIDGLALNVPECPNELVMLEFKTMNDSRFKQFLSRGLDNFQGYYNQCLINMKCMNELAKEQLESVIQSDTIPAEVNHTLFVAVNKNTDEIHAVLIQRDDDVAQRFIQTIAEILDNEIPAPLHESPKYFDCKLCSFKKYCFEEAVFPQNCRLCQAHSYTDDSDSCVFDFKECTEKCFIPFASQIKFSLVE